MIFGRNPVHNTLSLYFNYRYKDWKKIKDVLEGQNAIYAAGERYLARLSGQTDPEYDAYRGRGCFFNATSRSLQVLTGILLRKPPTFVDPNDAFPESVINDITGTGLTIWEYTRSLIENLISYGYCGNLVDVNEDGLPYLSLYSADSILNFAVYNKQLQFIVLSEISYEPNPDDMFAGNQIERIRIYYLEDSGDVFCEIYQMNEAAGFDLVEGPMPMLVRGVPLKKIPWVFYGASNNNHVPPRPPLIDLINLNLKHWQLSTDYYHGLHYCALPTPWAAGFDTTTALYLGPTKAWVSADPASRCGYLEFTGEGLNAIANALEMIERQMAVAGARLLEPPKKGVEAAETVERFQATDEATLSTIADVIENGLWTTLAFAGQYLGVNTDEVWMQLNRDYLVPVISPQKISALLQSYQAGAISLDTFLWNLRQGDSLPEDVSLEDEKKRIEEDAANKIENNEVVTETDDVAPSSSIKGGKNKSRKTTYAKQKDNTGTPGVDLLNKK